MRSCRACNPVHLRWGSVWDRGHLGQAFSVLPSDPLSSCVCTSEPQSCIGAEPRRYKIEIRRIQHYTTAHSTILCKHVAAKHVKHGSAARRHHGRACGGRGRRHDDEHAGCTSIKAYYASRVALGQTDHCPPKHRSVISTCAIWSDEQRPGDETHHSPERPVRVRSGIVRDGDRCYEGARVDH